MDVILHQLAVLLLDFNGYLEEPIEFNIVLDLKPDRVGKIDLAEDLVGT